MEMGPVAGMFQSDGKGKEKHKAAQGHGQPACKDKKEIYLEGLRLDIACTLLYFKIVAARECLSGMAGRGGGSSEAEIGALMIWACGRTYTRWSQLIPLIRIASQEFRRHNQNKKRDTYSQRLQLVHEHEERAKKAKQNIV